MGFPRENLLCVYFFDIWRNDAAHVETAIWANDVRWDRGAALRAHSQRTRLNAIVSAAAAGASVGMFAFWNSHRITCICLISFKFEFGILSTNGYLLNAQILDYGVKGRFLPIIVGFAAAKVCWLRTFVGDCDFTGPMALTLSNQRRFSPQMKMY